MMPVPTPPGAVPSPTPRPVVEDDGPDHATIEYGIPMVIKYNNDPFHTAPLFCKLGLSAREIKA